MLRTTKRNNNEFAKNCQFCKGDVEHMIVTMDKNGHVHVHAPFENPVMMKNFNVAIQRETEAHNKNTTTT